MAEESRVSSWNTIESDEGVFTSLIEQLGVEGVQFEELISLESESIRALSPVYGVIFLFQWIGSSSTSTQTPQDGQYDRTAVEDHGLFFATQTIEGACGTQAILSVVLNNDESSNPTLSRADASRERIHVGGSLRELKEFTTGFPPDLRGEALLNSALIRDTHHSFAKASVFTDETQRDPSAGPEEVFHFIGYTCHNGKLYELDGLQPFPISHGDCTPENFPDKIIPVLQKRIDRYPAGEVRFNLMAVCGDLRKKALAFGDSEMIAREMRKRKAWAWENALRQHNFVDFISEVLKGVVETKVQQGMYDEWVDEAKAKTETRHRARKAKQEAM